MEISLVPLADPIPRPDVDDDRHKNVFASDSTSCHDVCDHDFPDDDDDDDDDFPDDDFPVPDDDDDDDANSSQLSPDRPNAPPFAIARALARRLVVDTDDDEGRRRASSNRPPRPRPIFIIVIGPIATASRPASEDMSTDRPTDRRWTTTIQTRTTLAPIASVAAHCRADGWIESTNHTQSPVPTIDIRTRARGACPPRRRDVLIGRGGRAMDGGRRRDSVMGHDSWMFLSRETARFDMIDVWENSSD